MPTVAVVLVTFWLFLNLLFACGKIVIKKCRDRRSWYELQEADTQLFLNHEEIVNDFR